MIFEETEIDGVWIMKPEPIPDERGSFARLFSSEEMAEHGLESRMVQANTSFNAKAGTLRGLHYQEEPHSEVKIVCCTAGSIFDVAADIRPGSQTFGKWVSAELTAENRKMLYVPKGCAHGFQTLEDATEVFYLVSEYYRPGSTMGVRFDDPTLGVDWPEAAERVISERDLTLPHLG
jgi:dTDP-4-dehydrorhamnose 3,5-epimerase